MRSLSGGGYYSTRKPGSPKNSELATFPRPSPREPTSKKTDVVPKALFLCVEELSGKRYTHAQDRWTVRPATAEESDLLDTLPGASVIHLIHTASDENGGILEVSESVWPADRIIVLDDYDIPQDPEDLQGLSDI